VSCLGQIVTTFTAAAHTATSTIFQKCSYQTSVWHYCF